MTAKLLVTGASGQLGQGVLHHLVNTLGVPANRIIATSRKTDSLAAWAAKGVEVRVADFEVPATLDSAFAGAERLLLISTDTLDRPGVRLAQQRNAVAAAARAGVAHVLYTSMPKPENSALLFAPDHAGTEAALAASTLANWTVLRHNWYYENLLMSLPNAFATGQWYTAAGDGKIAHISRGDLALAAATALSSATTGKKTLTLTGERAYSTAEIAQIASAAVGKPIQVIQVPLEGMVQGMISAGLPEPLARVFASADVNTANGGLADVTSDFKQLVGKAPQPFGAWVDAHKAELSAAPRAH